MNVKLVRSMAIPLVLGAAIWFWPLPEGVTLQAWRVFAVMAATIVAFITAPLPMGAVAFISMAFVVLSGTLTMREGLSGFASPSVWLIFAAFLFSRGFMKTGLGKRIAFMILRAIGDSTLKVAYAFVLSGLFVAPAMPSSTARAGGVIFPILRGVVSALGSEPGPTARRAGAFLILCYYQVDGVLAAMFLTAMTANPLAAELAQKVVGIDVSWGIWALAASLPGVISLLLVPLFVYWLYPPELKHAPQARALANEELNRLGPVTRPEIILLGIFLLSLLAWCTSTITRMDATLVAVIAVSLMLITNIVNWQDVQNEKSAWDTLVWMGVLVGLAGHLSSKGFIPWFAKAVSGSMAGISWPLALSLLVVIYLYSQYGFASLTAHVAGMYAAFLAVAVALGAPPYLATLLFGFAGCLCSGLTHYSVASGPILYSADFVPLTTWCRVGFLTSVLLVAIWGTIGSIWWKVLGLW